MKPSPEASSSHSEVSKNTARSSPGRSGRTWSTIATKSEPLSSLVEMIQRQPDCPSAYCSSETR